MMITLINGDDVNTAVNLHYAGDAVVLEATASGIKSHYFKTRPESIQFIIEQSYALLRLGYEIYDEEKGKEE